ncbi:MAG: transposase, partial [Actinomycetia bacterium]|nr:transposase [Actinomycetes bacterium]
RDRGDQYTRSFDNVFAAIGADVIHTPPGAPRANAFAERWVRSVRHELLDRTQIWNQRQLRRLLDEYTAHYNSHRPHQAVDRPRREFGRLRSDVLRLSFRAGHPELEHTNRSQHVHHDPGQHTQFRWMSVG